MGANQRDAAFVGGLEGGAIAEGEREVLPVVDEPVEGEDSSIRRISVCEPQGQLDPGADRRRWEPRQHPLPRSASWNRDERA